MDLAINYNKTVSQLLIDCGDKEPVESITIISSLNYDKLNNLKKEVYNYETKRNVKFFINCINFSTGDFFIGEKKDTYNKLRKKYFTEDLISKEEFEELWAHVSCCLEDIFDELYLDQIIDNISVNDTVGKFVLQHGILLDCVVKFINDLLDVLYFKHPLKSYINLSWLSECHFYLIESFYLYE